MDWPTILQRTSLVSGLISLGLALWGGTHLQHILNDGGGRHMGEVLVFVILALVFFSASQYGARRSAD